MRDDNDPFAPDPGDDEVTRKFKLAIQRMIGPFDQGSEVLVSAIREIGIAQATLDFMRRLDRRSEHESPDYGCLAPLLAGAADVAFAAAIRSELERLIDERGGFSVAMEFLKVQDPKTWREVQGLMGEAGEGGVS